MANAQFLDNSSILENIVTILILIIPIIYSDSKHFQKRRELIKIQINIMV